MCGASMFGIELCIVMAEGVDMGATEGMLTTLG